MESNSAQSTILIVDDDLAILEYAGGVLEEYGYAVLTASNAASALVMLRSNEGIDLLFSDPAPNGRLLKKPYRPQQLAGAIAAALAW